MNIYSGFENIGKVIGFLSISILLVMSETVTAEAPDKMEYTMNYTVVDACTGELVDATLTRVVTMHLGHPNNAVIRIDSTGEATNGYRLIVGDVTQVVTKRIVTVNFADFWLAPDGHKMQTRGKYLVDRELGTYKVNKVDSYCIN